MSLDYKEVNNHVVKYLDYYCNLKNAPEFAVLLKGEWGAGKTWFINNYIKKLNKEKKKCCYISLYGMTSLSQIEDALFLKQLHPVLSSKPVMFAGSLLKNAFSLGMRIDFDGNKKDEQIRVSGKDIKLSEFLIDFSKSILIFDDLERCGVEVANVLGFINNFVEHQGSKVIIVANEEKFSMNKEEKEDKDNTYGSIKEKLIGKTLTISLDFEGAIRNFIDLVRDEEIKTFLLNKIESIESLYQVAKYQNLRTLRQAVLDFERIFDDLPEEVKSNLEALEVLLRLLIIFSIEIKLNNIKSKDISEFYEKHRSVVNSQENEEEKTLLQKLQKILEKYGDFRLKIYRVLDLPFPNFVWWGEFLDKGILDKEKLTESITNSVYFPDKNTPDWIKIWHYTELNDDEFKNIFDKVESKYSLENSNEESININEIQQVLGLFLFFTDAGLYFKSKQEILQMFKNYTKKLNENNKLNIPFLYGSSFLRETENYIGLGFQANKYKEFIDFSAYIEEVRKEAISNELPSVAQKLLDVMGEDVWKFYKMVVKEDLPVWDEENGKYADVPVLAYIEKNTFLEKFLQLSYKDKRNICHALDKRHDFKKRDLLEELDWLKGVLRLIEQEVISRKGKLSAYLLQSLIVDYFNKTINKIETHAKSEE